MRVADRRQFRLINKRRKLPKWASVSLIVFGALVGLFVMVNLGVLLVYRGKVLPNYSVAAVPIGGMAFGDLDKKVPVEKLLPAHVAFAKDDRSKQMTPRELGVAVDWAVTQDNIKKTHPWLPILSLFVKQTVVAELKLDTTKFATAAQQLEEAFTKKPQPERIVFQGDDFAIVEPEAGYQPDIVQLRLDVITTLEKGKRDLAVPTTATEATEPTGKLQDELNSLKKYLSAEIKLSNGAQQRQLSRSDIAGFFEPSGQTLKLSEAAMVGVINGAAQGLGITPINQSEAAQASLYALSKQRPITFRLVGQGTKLYHYCVAAKGVDAAALPEFRRKLAAVYGDPRSWGNDGKRALAYAESGCDFTAWLSSADNMTTFSASICDNYYSCRVGANVIINYDRWVGATDPWNAVGGTLEDYRVMVINHETGHWFGFAHRTCPGAGQPAPVMQQQSIDLQGCTFNPWPTAAELAVL